MFFLLTFQNADFDYLSHWLLKSSTTVRFWNGLISPRAGLVERNWARKGTRNNLSNELSKLWSLYSTSGKSVSVPISVYMYMHIRIYKWNLYIRFFVKKNCIYGFLYIQFWGIFEMCIYSFERFSKFVYTVFRQKILYIRFFVYTVLKSGYIHWVQRMWKVVMSVSNNNK